MRIIKRGTLKSFWEKHTAAKGALETWYHVARKGKWSNFNEIRQTFGSADVIAGNREVFNIRGNSYRLVVKIHYNTQTIYIRFIGTHAEYGKIDAETM